MKIGFDRSIAQTNQAGTGIYAASLLEALQQVAPEHEYHTFASARRWQMGQQKTLLSRAGVIYQDVLWTHAILPAQAARSHIDVLHTPAHVIPVLAPCPTVVSILDALILKTPENFTRWHRNYARVFVPLSARQAAAILTISEHSKRDLVETLKVSPDKVHVTYLAASPRFHPVAIADIYDAREQYAIHKPFILSVGTLEPRKNITRLVQAFAQLNRTDYQVIHVGPKGWQYDDILAEAQRLGLQDTVRFLGHVPLDDLVKLYNAASLFVYPSLYEGFGIPVLEAMACGCPVITSNTSSLPEVAGDAAILIDPTDTQQLADAIQRVLEDRPLADSLNEKGLANARRFSWERCAQETLAVYRQAPGVSPRDQ